MNVKHLKYFVMAIDLGSYSAAAREAGVTQPTISSAIKSLEKEFGNFLVLPNKEGLELTNAGQSLLESSRTLLGDAERIREDMQRMKNVEEGNIAIGIRKHLMTSTMHKLLDRFTRDNPSIDLKIRTGDYFQLREKLLGAGLDFVIDHSPISKPPADVETELLMRDPFMVFMRSGHPESDKQDLPIEIINEYPLLYPRDLFQRVPGLAARIHGLFEGIRPAIDIEDVNLMANIVANSDRNYVFVWTYQLFETWLKQGKLVGVRVGADNWSIPVGVTYRSKRLLSPAANKFIGELRKECQQLTDQNNNASTSTVRSATGS
jgi:DNA-binding transcriptional LysR family regulator